MSRLKVVANSLVGGSVVGILLRQSMLSNARRIASLRTGISAVNAPPISNPMPWVVGVPVSVRKQESYVLQADITTHAMEQGALLSDHVIIQPARVDLVFEVSNWEPGHGEHVLDLFEDMFRSRALVELVTEHKKLENMVMISFQSDNNDDVWGALKCTASFQQVRFVEIATEKKKRSKQKVQSTSKTGGPPSELSSESPSNKGLQVPKEQSTLRGLFRGLSQ